MGRNNAGFSWLLQMAWRDGKASYGKLLLFVFSITLGVAAVVSVHSFSKLLKENIASQSKALLGADYVIESDKPVNDKVMGIMDSLGGADAREINFMSMAAFPGNEGTKLMEVRGVEGGFPFYGELETEPVSATNDFRNGGALVDATTMLQLNLKVGDSIKLGAVTLPIAGELETVPGSTSVFGAIAPPILIPFEFIASTGLVQPEVESSTNITSSPMKTRIWPSWMRRWTLSSMPKKPTWIRICPKLDDWADAMRILGNSSTLSVLSHCSWVAWALPVEWVFMSK